MSDNVTNELLLEHLKRIREDISRVNDRIGSLETRFLALEQMQNSMLTRLQGIQADVATLNVRVERIERRLDLVET